MKTLRFRIGTDGNVTLLDAEGYGSSCQEATAGIEAALGKALESTRQATDSMYQKQDPIKLTLDQ